MRVGVSCKLPETAGALTKSIACGVKPYPINSRKEASEPKSFARPNTPVSKLHSPCELVGVARPKTGPCPSAIVLGTRHRQDSSVNISFMIPSECATSDTRGRASVSLTANRGDQSLRTIGEPGGDGEATTLEEMILSTRRGGAISVRASRTIMGRASA